jgi:hypothetical protein
LRKSDFNRVAYFREWINMSGALQAVFQNQRSFGPPAIGSAYEGGFYAGQISTTANGVATHYLIVAPVSSGENGSKQWKTSNTSTAGTSSVIDGPTNSANMNYASYPAAQFCEAVNVGGYTDWYMPAKNELEICYYNLKPTTTANNSSGANTNAVPSRGSNYTAGTPAQTSAADFKDTGAEDFAAAFYWSSTEYSTAGAWSQTFSNGGQYYFFIKTSSLRVRCVRRLAI